MPKGIYSIHPDRIEKLRNRVEDTVGLTLHSNKNFEALSDFIFKHTGDLLSKSTLRRVFQFNSARRFAILLIEANEKPNYLEVIRHYVVIFMNSLIGNFYFSFGFKIPY